MLFVSRPVQPTLSKWWDPHTFAALMEGTLHAPNVGQNSEARRIQFCLHAVPDKSR